MRFDIITIFPKIAEAYFSESMVKRAQAKKLADFRVHDLRDYGKEAPRHVRGDLPPRRQIDGRPYGGGPGMVLQADPIVRVVSKIARPGAKIILTSAGGKAFIQKMARDWAKKYKQIVIICGHYEGIDERVRRVIYDLGFKIEELSIGPYILTGGELPALVITDAMMRHIPGVLGKQESLEEIKGSYPVFSRPEIFLWPPLGRGKKSKKYKVPSVLLSGDHKKIAAWRRVHK